MNCIVNEVEKSQTRLSDFHFQQKSKAGEKKGFNINTLPCVRQIASGTLLYNTGSSAG